MFILPDYNRPYILDSLTAPIVVKHYWIFNAVECDFFLNQIQYLEETTTDKAFKLRINGTDFWVPSAWHILVIDMETCQVDTIPIQECAKKNYLAFCFSPTDMNLRTLPISVVDAASDPAAPTAVVHPMISKGTALVHPVGPAMNDKSGITHQLNVVIGPHDLHKYISSKVAGDFVF